MLDIQKLEAFRRSFYEILPVRRDATLNLYDALSADGHTVKSVTELCESRHYERQYPSITDAISNGLPHAPWKAIQKVAYNSVRDSKKRTVVVVDTTPQPRPFAKTLVDRHYTHSANPVPGNKPIRVGHQYSVLSYLPAYSNRGRTSWLIPMDTQRVSSDEKGHEAGMRQVGSFIDNLSLQNELVVSIADSAYGTDNCREIVSAYPNLVSIFRLKSNRNIFSIAEIDDQQSAGNKKRYDEKMKLNDVSTHRPPDAVTEFCWTTRGGKQQTIKVECWYDQLLRGTNTYRGYEHPMTVARISAYDPSGKMIYQHPLWIAVLGKRRNEISAFEIFDYYLSRYDIEHFFRFGKEKLLLDDFHTFDTEHEEDWWRLATLAYTQLYLARKLVALLPKKWERYLPIYKNQGNHQIKSPAQTQRGFSNVLQQLEQINTTPVQRGNPLGRSSGDLQEKREELEIVCKQKKQQKPIISGSEKKAKLPEPQKIDELLTVVKSTLEKIDFTTENFIDLLQKTA